MGKTTHSQVYILDIIFRQIIMFIKVPVTFVLGLQTLKLIDYSKIYQLKGMEPKNKGHTNFYEHCDSNENVYLSRGTINIITMSKKSEVNL